MWLVLMLMLGDVDSTCDEKTFVTNLGHVCEIVRTRVPMIEVRIPTKWGGVISRMTCPQDSHATDDGECEVVSFKVLYETVYVYENPRPWVMVTKFGVFRHEGWYVCRSGFKMTSDNLCEGSYERRVAKK